MNEFGNAEVTSSGKVNDSPSLKRTSEKAKDIENEADEEVRDDCFDFDEMEDMIIVDEVDEVVCSGEESGKKKTSKRTAKRSKKLPSVRKSSTTLKSSARKNENTDESEAKPSVLESSAAPESSPNTNENSGDGQENLTAQISSVVFELIPKENESFDQIDGESSVPESLVVPESSPSKNENSEESNAAIPESSPRKNEDSNECVVVERCSSSKDSSDTHDKDVPPTLPTTCDKLAKQYPYRLMFPSICLPRICVDSYIRGKASVKSEPSKPSSVCNDRSKNGTEKTKKKSEEKKNKDSRKKSSNKTKETKRKHEEKKIEDFRRKSCYETKETEMKIEEKKIKDSGKKSSNETEEPEKKIDDSGKKSCNESKETEKKIEEKKVKDSGKKSSNDTGEPEKKIDDSGKKSCNETKETEGNIEEKKVKDSGKKSSSEIEGPEKKIEDSKKKSCKETKETEKKIEEKKVKDSGKKSSSETSEPEKKLEEKKIEDSRKKSSKDSKNRNSFREKEKKIGNTMKKDVEDDKIENSSSEQEKNLVDSGDVSNSAKKKLLKNFKIPRLKKEKSFEGSGNESNLEEQKTKLEDSENAIEDQDSSFIPEKEGGVEETETAADLWDERNDKTAQHSSKIGNAFDSWCDDDDERTADSRKRRIAFENWNDDDGNLEFVIYKTDSGDGKRKKVSDTRDFRNDNVPRISVPIKRDTNFAKRGDFGSREHRSRSFEEKGKEASGYVGVSRIEEFQSVSRIPERGLSSTPKSEVDCLDHTGDGALPNNSRTEVTPENKTPCKSAEKRRSLDSDRGSSSDEKRAKYGSTNDLYRSHKEVGNPKMREFDGSSKLVDKKEVAVNKASSVGRTDENESKCEDRTFLSSTPRSGHRSGPRTDERSRSNENSRDRYGRNERAFPHKDSYDRTREQQADRHNAFYGEKQQETKSSRIGNGNRSEDGKDLFGRDTSLKNSPTSPAKSRNRYERSGSRSFDKRDSRESRTKTLVSKGVQCDRWKDLNSINDTLPLLGKDQKADVKVLELIEKTNEFPESRGASSDATSIEACTERIGDARIIGSFAVSSSLKGIEDHTDEKTKDENSGDLTMDVTDEKFSEVSPILEEYQKSAKFDPDDFDTWTHLLRLVDQGPEDHIPVACEVYDDFLFKYPYCYGYWRKYANFLKRHGRKTECERVFERGVLATPLSIDLWIHYLDYIRETYPQDENRLRELFERSLQFCGFEFRSDNLWETYIRWETCNGCLTNVTKILDRWLKVPTREYITVMNKFIEHVEKHSLQDILSGAEYLHLLLWIESRRKSSDTDLTPAEKKTMKEKIISVRREYHEKTKKAFSDRWSFEENIKRPYFHILPLEDYQLDNWRRYLDFEIKGGDRERITVLFERCLIACALYEEFWIKFADYLLSLPGKDVEKVRVVFTRATTHHSKSIKLHLKWAQFEQTHGDPTAAASILEKMEKSCPSVLMLMVRRINLLRLRGEFQLVCSLYEQYMKSVDDAEANSSLELKYTSLCNQAFNDVQNAYGVLQEAIGKNQTKSLDLPILSNCQHRWFYVCTSGHFHAIYRSVQAKYWNERKGYESGEFVITDVQPGGPRISVSASEEMKRVKVEDDSCDIDQCLVMTSDQNYDKLIPQKDTASSESALAKNPVTISNWTALPERVLQTNQSYFNMPEDEPSKVQPQISSAKAQILPHLSSAETPTSIEQGVATSAPMDSGLNIATQPPRCEDLVPATVAPVIPMPPIMQSVLPQRMPLVRPLGMPPAMSTAKPAVWIPPVLDEDSRRKNIREVIKAYNFEANSFNPDSNIGAPSIAVIEPFQRRPAQDYYRRDQNCSDQSHEWSR